VNQKLQKRSTNGGAHVNVELGEHAITTGLEPCLANKTARRKSSSVAAIAIHYEIDNFGRKTLRRRGRHVGGECEVEVDLRFESRRKLRTKRVDCLTWVPD
jgi:hypothetical protein